MGRKTEKPKIETKGGGRPRTGSVSLNERMTLQLPAEYRKEIDECKREGETYSDFIRRSIVFMCAAVKIDKNKQLLDNLRKIEKTDLNNLEKAVKEVLE